MVLVRKVFELVYGGTHGTPRPHHLAVKQAGLGDSAQWAEVQGVLYKCSKKALLFALSLLPINVFALSTFTRCIAPRLLTQK